VLIDDDGNARLSDFGLSQVISEAQSGSVFTSAISGPIDGPRPNCIHSMRS
jgi:hypothetical protein